MRLATVTTYDSLGIKLYSGRKRLTEKQLSEIVRDWEEFEPGIYLRETEIDGEWGTIELMIVNGKD